MFSNVIFVSLLMLYIFFNLHFIELFTWVKLCKWIEIEQSTKRKRHKLPQQNYQVFLCFFVSRWTYEEFFSRYRLLLRGPQGQEQAQVSCRLALPELIQDPDQYCFGKTKVFFRAGQVALLERLRAERLRVAAVIIQSRVKGWLARIRYTRICWATVTIQRYCRGALARRWA